MRLTLRDKKFLVGGGLICLLALLIVYGGLPLVENLKDISTDMESKRELLARYRSRVAAKEKYLAKLEEMKKRFASFDPLFLETTEKSMASSNLQDILSKIAADSGFAVVRREFQNEPKRLNEEYQRVSAKIDSSCTPEQLVNFLVTLRNYPKHLYITEFSLRSNAMMKGTFQLIPTIQVSAIIKSPEIKEKAKGNTGGRTHSGTAYP
jgi:hypothetical protein